MAVNLVKGVDGGEVMVPSSGKVNGALTTGIIGTSLAGLLALGGGGAGGLFGGGGIGNGVDKDLFYQTQIASINTANGQFADVNQKICNLQAELAVAQTANTYQNQIRDILINGINQRFATERLVTDFEIGAKTCKFVEGRTYLSPRDMASSYVDPSREILSRDVYNHGHRGGYPEFFDGGCAPCGR